MTAIESRQLERRESAAEGVLSVIRLTLASSTHQGSALLRSVARIAANGYAVAVGDETYRPPCRVGMRPVLPPPPPGCILRPRRLRVRR